MLTILIVCAAMFAVVILPFKTFAAVTLIAAINVLIIKYSTQAITGTETSLRESFKALLFSFLFATLAVTAISSFSSNTGIHTFEGLAALSVLGILLASYVAGYSIALSTAFWPSAAIAAVSVITSTTLLSIVN